MNQARFEQMQMELIAKATQIQNSKNPAYTVGSDDVVKNFKRIGEQLGLDPMIIWAVYAAKHFQAIVACAKDANIPQSEPIEERFADMFNYLLMGYALLEDRANVINMTTKVKQ